MKLLRFGEPGKEKPGILSNNEILDVSSFGEDFGEKFFETDGIQRLKKMAGRKCFKTSEGKTRRSLRFAFYEAVKNYMRWIKLCEARSGIQHASP